MPRRTIPNAPDPSLAPLSIDWKGARIENQFGCFPLPYRMCQLPGTPWDSSRQGWLCSAKLTRLILHFKTTKPTSRTLGPSSSCGSRRIPWLSCTLSLAWSQLRWVLSPPGRCSAWVLLCRWRTEHMIACRRHFPHSCAPGSLRCPSAARRCPRGAAEIVFREIIWSFASKGGSPIRGSRAASTILCPIRPCLLSWWASVVVGVVWLVSIRVVVGVLELVVLVGWLLGVSGMIFYWLIFWKLWKNCNFTKISGKILQKFRDHNQNSNF